jgi:hypothetical protein
LLEEGRLVVEFESSIKPAEETIKLLWSLVALLTEKDQPVPENQREPFLLLIYTGRWKFPDGFFWRGFGVLNFRVISLNELDAGKEIAELWEKAKMDPGFKTSRVWVLFLLLFLPLAKGFNRKRISDCSALARKILEKELKVEYLNCMMALYGHILAKLGQDTWTTEENLIMKSTNPLPLEMQDIDVVADINKEWEFELIDKRDLEEAVEKAREEARVAQEEARVAMQKASAKLILEGMSFEKISEITGLSLEQVRSLGSA